MNINRLLLIGLATLAMMAAIGNLSIGHDLEALLFVGAACFLGAGAIIS